MGSAGSRRQYLHHFEAKSTFSHLNNSRTSNEPGYYTLYRKLNGLVRGAAPERLKSVGFFVRYSGWLSIYLLLLCEIAACGRLCGVVMRDPMYRRSIRFQIQ